MTKVLTKKYFDDGRPPESIFVDSEPVRTISRAEQQQTGLIRRNYTAPLQGEILPPTKVQQIPTVSDPYAEHLPQQVQQVVRYDVTPESRARSMVMKVHQVTILLAILTGAGMYMLTELTFGLWLLLASSEWVAVFIVLAVLDYREQPAALSRMTADRYLGMMEREQAARLRAMYGDDTP